MRQELSDGHCSVTVFFHGDNDRDVRYFWGGTSLEVYIEGL